MGGRTTRQAPIERFLMHTVAWLFLKALRPSPLSEMFLPIPCDGHYEVNGRLSSFVHIWKAHSSGAPLCDLWIRLRLVAELRWSFPTLGHQNCLILESGIVLHMLHCHWFGAKMSDAAEALNIRTSRKRERQKTRWNKSARMIRRKNDRFYNLLMDLDSIDFILSCHIGICCQHEVENPFKHLKIAVITKMVAPLRPILRSLDYHARGNIW